MCFLKVPDTVSPNKAGIELTCPPGRTAGRRTSLAAAHVGQVGAHCVCSSQEVSLVQN